MDIARLGIVLDAVLARQQLQSLRADLLALGTAANAGAQAANQNLNRVGQTARQTSQQVKSSASDMERSMVGAMGRVGAAIGAAFGVSQLARFGQESVRTNIEFRRMENIMAGVTGSAMKAKEQMAFIADESNRLGLNFRTTGTEFVKFAAAANGSSITQGQLRDIFSETAESLMKLGATTFQQQRVFTAYQQMISKGVVSMEELRQQLGDSLPGAFQIAAKSMGLTTREFIKLVESGKLLTQDFLPNFTKQLSHDTKGAVDDLAVAIGRLENAWDKFKNAIGETARPTFQSAAEGLEAVVNKETVGLNALNLYRSIGGGKSTTSQQMDALRNAFPNAYQPKPTVTYERNWFSTLPTAKESIDFVKEYERMAGEEPGFARMKSAKYQRDIESNPLFQSGLPTLPESQPLDSSLSVKFEREMNKLTLDRLEGRDRLIESYKQEEQAIIALGLPLDKEAQLVTLIRRNRDEATGGEYFKDMQDNAKRLGDEMEDLNKKAEKLFFETLNEGASRAAKINQQFKENVSLLIQLEEYGANTNGTTYDQLVEARDRALNTSEPERRRGRNRSTQGVGDVLAGWGTMEERIREGSANMAQSIDTNFTDAFSSMIMGTQSVSEAFSNMATSIVGDLVRVMVQQLIVRSVMQGIGLASGISGMGNPSTDSSAVVRSSMTSDIRSAYVRHDGGTVGVSNGPIRRFHDSGVSGDEQMVVNRRGEVYFTPEQMGVLGKAISGGKGSSKVEIVNVEDPSLFTEKLMKNKNVILNIIGRESKTIRRQINS